MAEEIAKAVQLEVQGAGSSKQPIEDVDQWTPEEAISPPEDLEALSEMTKAGGIRRSCIAATVLNTVGLGFELNPRKGAEEDLGDDPEKATAEAREHLDALARRDVRLRSPSFVRLLSTVAWDLYECGNGAIEVSRNRTSGAIDGLYHAPGKRVRRAKERDGWMIGPRKGSLAERERYYNFGEKVVYSGEEKREPTAKLQKNGLRWETNELIVVQLYTSESRDYGLPPDAQLAVDYLGDKLAGDQNVGFFNSSGVPPTVIFVQGEEREDGEVVRIEVPQTFSQQIADALRSGKGQRARVAVIGVPAGFGAQVENLAVLSERDMGFVQYRADNRRRTLGAFRLSPVFVADIEDAGKYTADVERQLTKEQVFDPEQQAWTDLLHATLLGELFPDLELRFNAIAIEGDEARRQSANDAADRGAITRGEFREAHQLPPLPEAEEGQEPEPGQVPFGWNAEVMPARSPGPAPPATGTSMLPPLGPPSGNGTAPEEELAKGSSLESEIEETFTSAVEDAISRVRSLSDEPLELAPVVVEKDGGEIVVRPFEANGSGP